MTNLRAEDLILTLGRGTDGAPVSNRANFPPAQVDEPGADPIYEIPNAFPFRGTTFIGKSWADRTAADPAQIRIPKRPWSSMTRAIHHHFGAGGVRRFLADLPRPMQLAVAAVSTDPADLTALADICCDLVRDADAGPPVGLLYQKTGDGRDRPVIRDEQLFDAVANNPWLPDDYKEVMVLRPGVQGQSEIVGSWRQGGSHIFEYLRRNSYIPWGHYAANMAHDTVRYAAGDLTTEDSRGLRHLYYQRTYERLARMLDIAVPQHRRAISTAELEPLRQAVLDAAGKYHERPLPFNATLWGWNYGYDYAPNGYRLHASHQQIHQQYAMIPSCVPVDSSEGGLHLPAYACGDMIQDFIQMYQRQSGQSFFESYQNAIASNQRMDGRTDRPNQLTVHQDDNVMLFVPKAQTSQWELQLMTRPPVGNILEADEAVRDSLDQALLLAMQVLTSMGATMITVLEYSKRFDIADRDQRLLYAFLPRLPESPGAFSEAQLRWINGHYPEDFACACRMQLQKQ